MGWEIALSLLFCGFVLLFARFGAGSGDRNEAGSFALRAGLLFCAGLTVRLVVAYYAAGYSTDLDAFKSWGHSLSQQGLRNFYFQDDYFADYPPGYLYVLLLLEKLRDALGLSFYAGAYDLLMKLPSILGDLACAGALLWLGKRRLGEREGLTLSACYLFCPVVLANSAQWGQVDSVTATLLLASVLLLYRELYVPCALLYGLSIACKPQMLIFAPVFLFFAVRRRRWGMLALGVGCTVGMILLLALPFTRGPDFTWLVRRYQNTMDYYSYYSINAYNFWTAIGLNWRTLPGGWALRVLNWSAPVVATTLCGVLLLLSKRKEAVFAAPVLLMTVMYLFGVKMHERYLYPIFLFLLAAWAFTPRRVLLTAFAPAATVNHLNVAHVLWLYRTVGGSYDPNALSVRVLAALQCLALGLVLFALWRVYLSPGGEKDETAYPLPHIRLPRVRRGFSAPARHSARFTRADRILVCAVTAVYALVGFWRLGGHETALTWWAPAQGESAVLRANAPCDRLIFLPGIAPDDQERGAKFGAQVLVETSGDGTSWTEDGRLSDSAAYVFDWTVYRLHTPGAWVRLTAENGTVVLNEAALGLLNRDELATVTLGEGSAPGAATLLDEQSVAPLYPSYENSSYFDEIYHARTGYEHVLDLEPYENTHPPLGKLMLSLGIRLFGMNPFGWRFMGTLCGVLMLPILYHLLRQLFEKPWLCAFGTAVFALDFMHFTQTRIATIDTYAVLFLLLMYDAMLAFLRRDLLRDSLPRLLAPLCLSGIFMGLGVAAKWNAAYGAVGLAVLFFGKLLLTRRDEMAAGGAQPQRLARRAGTLCLWCCLFFLIIPFGLYFASFLPITLLPHNRGDVWGNFVRYQTNMYHYHATLEATHYFASPWYEWPLDVRPIWFFSENPADAAGHYSTISSFGNPLLWWAGLPAVLSAAWFWWKERRTWAALVLCGFGAVYLPWVLVPRLTFIYHYFTAVPFLAVALTGVLARFAETAPGGKELAMGRVRISVAQCLGLGFALACGALFLAFFPVISGAATDKGYTDGLRWFSTWYF